MPHSPSGNLGLKPFSLVSIKVTPIHRVYQESIFRLLLLTVIRLDKIGKEECIYVKKLYNRENMTKRIKLEWGGQSTVGQGAILYYFEFQIFWLWPKFEVSEPILMKIRSKVSI